MALDIALDDLKALLVLLRAEGVTQFSHKDLDVRLGDKPSDAEEMRAPRRLPPELDSLPAGYLDPALGFVVKVS